MAPKLFREHQYIIFDYSLKSEAPARNESKEFRGYRVSHFSGQSFGVQKMIAADFSYLDIDVLSTEDLADSQGEWIAVAEKASRTGREFLVFADAFGYGSVFYAFIDNSRFVISDSFHGVASALARVGQKKTVNVANYVSSLTSPLTYFQNTFSSHTMIEEIQLLRPDQLIHICQSSGITFHSRSSLGRALSLDSYDSAIEDGLKLADSVLSGISSHSQLSKRITLSGGVDSRVVLALLVASGLHEEFSVHSVDPRGWHNSNTRETIERDIEIADMIRRDYGMVWWAPGKREAISAGLRESLQSYQSYRSNLNYSYQPVNMFSYHVIPTATLRGGGGEILSATAAGLRLQELFDKDASGMEPAIWMSRHFTKSSRLIPEYKPLAREYVEGVYRSFEQLDIRSTYESLYFNTRNRSHFGHMAYSRTANELALHMLSNPFFLRASELVSFNDKASGKVVKDIFEKTESSLLKYLFDSEEWSKRLTDLSQAIDAPEKKWVAAYEEAHSRAGGLEYAKGGELNNNSKGVLNRTRAGLNYLRSTFSLIEDLVAADQRELMREQHSIVLSRIEQGKMNLFRSLAKATSVLDGFAPQPTLGAQLERRCYLNERHEVFEIAPVESNKHMLASNEMFDLPVFEQLPTLELTDAHFKIESNFTAEHGEQYQFAYYLMRDGKRVADRWYEDTSEVVFENTFGPGEYQGIAHVRFKGRTSPAFYKKTNVIKV